jgi:DNA-binding HxlR family transcriptional regulator
MKCDANMAKKKEDTHLWQKEQKHKAETKIINALLDGAPKTYKKLVEITKISKATLSSHLKEMVLKGTILRILDQEKPYPYPVSYQLKNPLMMDDFSISNQDLKSKPKNVEKMLFKQYRWEASCFLHYCRKIMSIKVSENPQETKSQYYDAWVARAMGFASDNMENTLRYIIENGNPEWENIFGNYECNTDQFFQDLAKFLNARAKAEQTKQANERKKIKTVYEIDETEDSKP